jgi:hypothetical protein
LSITDQDRALIQYAFRKNYRPLKEVA